MATLSRVAREFRPHTPARCKMTSPCLILVALLPALYCAAAASYTKLYVSGGVYVGATPINSTGGCLIQASDTVPMTVGSKWAVVATVASKTNPACVTAKGIPSPIMVGGKVVKCGGTPSNGWCDIAWGYLLGSTSYLPPGNPYRANWTTNGSGSQDVFDTNVHFKTTESDSWEGTVFGTASPF